MPEPDKFAFKFKFFFPEESAEKLPAFGFVIPSHSIDSFLSSVLREAGHESTVSLAETYLQDQSPFYPVTQGLYGYEPFGFGRCATLSESENEVTVKVFLVDEENCRCTCLMLRLINDCIQRVFYQLVNEMGYRRLVQISVSIPDSENCYYHGHSVGGYLHKPIIDWLIKLAGSKEVEVRLKEAMVSAFKTIGKPLSFQEEDLCDCTMMDDGRFSMGVLGSATSLSIYPDQVDYPGLKFMEMVRFGSHNLDLDYQQLVLIAGLAMICRLAVEDVGV